MTQAGGPRTRPALWTGASPSGLDSILEPIGDLCLRMRARKVLTALAQLPSGSRVLDCGAGKPFFAGAARRLNLPLTVVSVDPEISGLRYRSDQIAELRIAADGFQLPFNPRTFDCILLSEVLEHVDDPSSLLQEVARVMRSSGVLIATVPCRDYPLLWDPVNRALETVSGRHVRTGFWSGIWAGHLRLYTPETFCTHLRLGGLEPNCVERVTGWCLPFSHNLLYLGARLFYGGHLPESVAHSVDRFADRNDSPTGIAGALLRVNELLERANEQWPRRRAAVSLYAEAHIQPPQISPMAALPTEAANEAIGPIATTARAEVGPG